MYNLLHRILEREERRTRNNFKYYALFTETHRHIIYLALN
ncbi:hypothetical protein Niako_1127 [Niastella koreensis GR20-10]|uniref:Uncharacterized protein n=1 Tax=Niastella koreensis (strain DSM 17620 / KACC 11465 / NBRC 106392 / GR20-10) TaxID=700598 RepID=G8TIY5_NIAKG|nr:hypothetical protein Niako_1127 [Niastella koreensis GR20-10]